VFVVVGVAVGEAVSVEDGDGVLVALALGDAVDNGVGDAVVVAVVEAVNVAV
jgi:hypothetical protein